MDVLTRIGSAGAEAVHLDGTLIPLLQQLQTDLDPEHAIDQLESHLAHPDPESRIGKLVAALGIDPAPLGELIEKNRQRIDSLLAIFQPLQAFGAHTLAFPVAKGGTTVSGLTLEGSAGFTATLTGETDAKLLAGIITFDAAREAVLHVGVQGTLKGSASGGAPAGSVAVQGAFEVGAELAIDNYFRHPLDDPTLAALAADAPLFTLPGKLGEGAALLSSQVVVMTGSGHLKLGGSLTWSQSVLSSANVTEKSLGLDTQVQVLAGAEAQVSFTYQLNGTFDIVVFSSTSDPAKVRVRLAKSRTKAREIGLELGVNVGVEGLDGAGQTVLGHFLPGVAALLQPLADNGDRFPDLRSLFTAKLDAGLDSLLARQTVTDQIQGYLKLILVKVDLREKLKELASDAVLGVTGAEIDALQSNLDKVTAAFKDLARKYLRALGRIRDALQEAAHARIGLVCALSLRQVETAGVALEFEIDPQRDHDLYLRMLQGDFAAAVAAVHDPAKRVTITQGALRDGGSVAVTSSLTFTAFGKLGLDQASILSEQWETVVSPTGEISIGVSGEVEESTRLLHEMRTATFFVDARTLGLLLDNGTLDKTSCEQKASLELTHELTPGQDHDVAVEEQTLRRLGALTDPGVSLVRDLVFKPQDPKNRFGTLVSSVILELGRGDLKALLTADPAKAQEQLIRSLSEVFPGHRWLATRDAHGTPFLLWPSIQPLGHGAFEAAGRTGSLEFKSGDGTLQNIAVGALVLVRFELLLLSDFRRAFGALCALQAAPGDTRDQVLAHLRDLQRTLLGNIRNMIAPPAMFDRYRISQALFQTLAKLTADQGGHPAPFVSIQRQEDKKLFTFT